MNRFLGQKGALKKVTNLKFGLREILPKIARLPPLLLDNPILNKHKRKVYLVLS